MRWSNSTEALPWPWRYCSGGVAAAPLLLRCRCGLHHDLDRRPAGSNEPIVPPTSLDSSKSARSPQTVQRTTGSAGPWAVAARTAPQLQTSSRMTAISCPALRSSSGAARRGGDPPIEFDFQQAVLESARVSGFVLAPRDHARDIACTHDPTTERYAARGSRLRGR